MFSRKFFWLRVLSVFGCLVVSGLWSNAPASADLSGDIDKANGSDESSEDGEPSAIDIQTAGLDEITEQLKTLNQQVNLLKTKKERYSTQKENTEDEAEKLIEEIAEVEGKIGTLETELAELAIVSFQRQGSSSIFIGEVDPSEAIRMRRLSGAVTKSEAEAAEELKQAQADLAAKQAAQGDLEGRQEADRQENQTSLLKFEDAQSAMVAQAKEAAEKAERVLAEADAVGQVDKEQADKLRESVAALNEQIRLVLGDEVEKEQKEAEANPESVDVPPAGDRPTKGDMRQIQGSIWVHKDIADRVDAMFNAARAAGIELSGGGFRDPAAQIAVRKNNCGTSQYAIYQMPASSCSPPTARPGKSMHEQGKAIDITYQGTTIKSRSSPAFIWLANNAANYGLQNLPSEPWHWSTNGR